MAFDFYFPPSLIFHDQYGILPMVIPKPPRRSSLGRIESARRFYMNENMLIIIAVSAFIIIDIAIVLVIIRSVRRKRTQETIYSNSEKLARGASGENTYNNIPYRYKHFRGTDKIPPYFSITIPCASSGMFTVTKESKFDRFFKKMNICTEISTQDPDFDNNFFIATDTIPFTRTFLENARSRQAIQTLFNLGFNHLKHDGKNLIATWNNYPRHTQMEVATMESAVAALSAPYEILPQIATLEAQDFQSGWRFKRIFTFVFTIGIAVTGLLTMVLMLTQYAPLDSGKMFLNSLKFSIPFFIFFLWNAVQLLKGHSTSHRLLIAVFFIALVGFPLAGFGYTGFLNGIMDKNPAAVHTVTVTEKYYTKNKNSYSYYAVVDSWRQEGKTENLGVSESFFDSLEPGESSLTVLTKPGEFGYEWLVSFHIKEQNRVNQ